MAPSADERARTLKVKRASFKIELSAFKEFIKTCDPSSQDIEIKNRLDELSSEFAVFTKYQGELDHVDETGELMRERIELKNLYFCHASHSQNLLRSIERSSNMSRGNLDQAANESSASADPCDTDVSLPSLQLPQFSGCYEEWPGFADQFKSAVHENVRLSDCRKLMYLRSCLCGEAARVIESLENSAANYHPAWELLEERYNKPAVIVANHVRALFNLPQINRVNHQNLRQFLTDLESHYRALKTLKQPSPDTLLIHLCLSRLDHETNLKWKEHIRDNAFPKLEELCKFLHDRCHDIEPCGPAINTRHTYPSLQQTSPLYPPTSRPPSSNNTVPYRVHAITYAACPVCDGSHSIYTCEKFTESTVPQRTKIISNKQLCVNCLRKGHSVSACKSSGCRVCQKRHNTLLHTDALPESQPTPSRVNVACLNNQTSSHIILSTAVIDVADRKGNFHRCRVLLDSCAQSNFLTYNFAKKLDLPLRDTRIPITGMNRMLSEVNHFAKARIQSRTTNFTTELTFLLTKQITESLPDEPIQYNPLELPKNVPLADPDFHKPARIDGLLGAQLFWHLLSIGQIKLPCSTIMLRKTLLGWLVTGENSGSKREGAIICNVAVNALDKQIAKFWELEEAQRPKILSDDEYACQDHYRKHTRRETSTGRYIVKLPFKNNDSKILDESHPVAMKRFLALEKALQRDPSTREQYINFMREYESLGHMTKMDICPKSEGYYLPHHAVRKEDSRTTKIRVVFDASARTTSGVSLNDILMTGPTIQDDLFSIVTRFRTHKYVLTADIAKMYRQVKLAPEDRRYHKILWRENSNTIISTYCLDTVTYGTASASYLAIKSLQQLAEDEGKLYPLAAHILKSDFYVDGLLTGANTIERASSIRDQLIKLTSRGGFELRQWSSNHEQLLKTLAVNDDTCTHIVADEFRKTLGLYWNQTRDTLGYTVKEHEPLRQVTKRTILSRIAQLFDPLGLVGPIIIKAKILMQRLWQLQLNWDESVPETLHTEWKTFELQLHGIEQIHIPRRILCENPTRLELHGFCDASERAYGACIYMRSTSSSGTHDSHLICSKTRVAPLKVQSLPRLELCAAVLLIDLFNSTNNSIKLDLDNIVFWTDSMITLHWINAAPHTLKVFVANRVSKIQECTGKGQWRHVPSQDNPADCLSRGLDSTELLRNSLWSNGPHWLGQSEETWPSSSLLPVVVPERRTVVSLATTAITTQPFIERFSTLGRLERAIAYCLRFQYNSRHKQRLSGPLCLEEVRSARLRIIKFVPQAEFDADIKALSNKGHF